MASEINLTKSSIYTGDLRHYEETPRSLKAPLPVPKLCDVVVRNHLSLCSTDFAFDIAFDHLPVVHSITSTTTPEELEQSMELNPGYTLGQRDEEQRSALSEALRLKNLNLIKYILGKRPDLANQHCGRSTPFGVLSNADDPSFVLEATKALIKNGADVNYQEEGNTPLHYLSLHAEFLESTKLLILNGAITQRYAKRQIELIEDSDPNRAEALRGQLRTIIKAIKELSATEIMRKVSEPHAFSVLPTDLREKICGFTSPV